MGKVKNYVKEETVTRINRLLKRHGNIESMEESEEFEKLTKNFINGFERKNLDKIIDLCYKGIPYDEIRYIIGGTDMPDTKKKNIIDNVNYEDEDYDIDPVAERTTYLINHQVVFESEPVEVIIGDIDNQKSAAEKVVKTDMNQNDTVESVDADSDISIDDTIVIGNLRKDESSKDIKDTEVKVSDVVPEKDLKPACSTVEPVSKPSKRQKQNLTLPTIADIIGDRIDQLLEKQKQFV